LRPLFVLKPWLVLSFIIANTIVFVRSHDLIASTLTGGSQYYKTAQEEFVKGNYDLSIKNYQLHLKKNRKDFDVWNELAASFYHTGVPDKALGILKKVATRTTQKSYNNYYQGLCYQALENIKLARIHFTRGAAYNDEYASRSIFELATIEYNKGNGRNAQYWLYQYRTRFPQGVYIILVGNMEKSLQTGILLKGISGNKKPDMEQALYKYNRLSLSETPHFWYFQLGFEAREGLQADPAPDQKSGIKNQEFGEQELVINTGIGVGPIRSKNATTYVGYNYKQNWITNFDRIQVYMDDPGDFSYFPFRPDLLERRHQFFADFGLNLPKQTFIGIYGEQEFKRIGSELFKGPDDFEGGSKVQNVSRTVTLIPRAGINYLQNFQTLVFIFMRKELNEEAPEFSNKTYSLFNKETVLSYGLSHRMGFDEIGLNINLDIFRFDFIYNDQWLDYTRTGFIFAMEYEFISNFKVGVSGTYYSDLYQVAPLKQNSCTFTQASGNNAAATEPQRCQRVDTGTIYSAGLQWNYSTFQNFSLKYIMSENKNPDQAVYNRTEATYYFMYTLAFPGTDRVFRLINKFSEKGFASKEE
jgi:hypothetical protein